MLRLTRRGLKNSSFLQSSLGVVKASYYLQSHSFTESVQSSTERAVSSKKLQFCVVGSGPSGFYTVSQLLKSFGDLVHVSLLERLPTPYGLIRSGVAPDHPETKNVINQFSQLGEDRRVSYFGNVNVGQDIPLSSLRSIFDAVILAYGAESNRVIDIPGRHHEGIFTAREFVWWYNGHPEYANLPIDLSKVRRVTILGLGNVALDCARILLQPPERLKLTDIASHALQQLLQSSVEQVDVIGRRGPAQAAFTAKELRELLKLEGISVVMPSEDMSISAADQAEMKQSRSKKRVFELLQKASQETADSEPLGSRRLRMRFFRNSSEILADELGRVRAVRLAKTRLEEIGTKRVAVTTGETEDIPAELVLESIGYKSLPLAGAAFDEQTGTIPNRAGRVLSSVHSEAMEAGLYVCGWVKRGPSGIIGTNLSDALETVNAICQDVQTRRLNAEMSGRDAHLALQNHLAEKGRKVISFRDWLKIDEAERKSGAAEGRERCKFVSVLDMLNIAT